jgi:IrrE N-terminal-like domain
MTEGWLRRTVEDFWKQVGQVFPPPPRNMEDFVAWALPITIEKVPNLRVSEIQVWLERYGIPYALPYSDRSLYGCLIAYRGHGVVLLDENDPDDQSRFSLAHEIAHFLVDYHQARERAISKLGPSIIEVLDGLRLQTLDERVYAVLGNISLGIRIDLMERPRDGSHCNDSIVEIEDRADRLALELLASADEVHQYIFSTEKPILFQEGVHLTTQILVEVFGLPQSVAQTYANYLYRSWYVEPSFQEWVGM